MIQGFAVLVVAVGVLILGAALDWRGRRIRALESLVREFVALEQNHHLDASTWVGRMDDVVDRARGIVGGHRDDRG